MWCFVLDCVCLPLSGSSPLTPQRCGTHRTDIIAQKSGRVTLPIAEKPRHLSGLPANTCRHPPRYPKRAARYNQFFFFFFFALDQFLFHLELCWALLWGLPAVTQLNSIPPSLCSSAARRGLDIAETPIVICPASIIALLS